MRFRIARPQRDGLTIMSYRLIAFATIAKGNSQVVMRHPATGILGQRCRVQSD